MAAIMCQVNVAVSFDYNYKFHSFYVFVDLFKCMLVIFKALSKTLLLDDSFERFHSVLVC